MGSLKKIKLNLGNKAFLKSYKKYSLKPLLQTRTSGRQNFMAQRQK
jgi:hypothetical protein